MFRIRWERTTGWGLYAGPDGVPSGTVLPYDGCPTEQRGDSAYVLLCGGVLIDGADPEGRIVWEDGTLSEPVGRLLPDPRVGVGYVGTHAGLARFVNHGTGRQRNVRLQANGRFRVFRNVAPGQQLLASYGASYWRRRGLLNERVCVHAGRRRAGRAGTVVRHLRGTTWRVRYDDGALASESLEPASSHWRLLEEYEGEARVRCDSTSRARMVWDGQEMRRAVRDRRGRWRFQHDGSPVPEGARFRRER